jgi:hypothetical protein
MPDIDEHRPDSQSATIPRIIIPEYVERTPEEQARLEELIAEMDRIREKIGPIGMSAVDLIDADFYEIDADGP